MCSSVHVSKKVLESLESYSFKKCPSGFRMENTFSKLSVIVGFWPGKSTFTKPGKLSGCGEVQDLLQGIIRKDANSSHNLGLTISF